MHAFYPDEWVGDLMKTTTREQKGEKRNDSQELNAYISPLGRLHPLGSNGKETTG